MLPMGGFPGIIEDRQHCLPWIRPQTDNSELKIITYSSININHGNHLMGLPSHPATIDAEDFS